VLNHERRLTATDDDGDPEAQHDNNEIDSDGSDGAADQTGGTFITQV